MGKDKVAYVCESCGLDSAKWIGKCPSCGGWNTFKEIRISGNRHRDVHEIGGGRDSKVLKLSDVSVSAEPRIDMCDSELNRVLGGGLVQGSLVLLGGEPGIGKSTLLLQTILRLSDLNILYVSGEESAHQLRMRSERIGGEASGAHVSIICETSLERIMSHLENERPDMVIIDSIQTLFSENVDSSPGSVSQVRECASTLLRYAKSTGIPVIMIGHINKEGTLAGPKVLEHIVDAVIQFEGDGQYLYRILRSIKNRFGSTSE